MVGFVTNMREVCVYLLIFICVCVCVCVYVVVGNNTKKIALTYSLRVVKGD